MRTPLLVFVLERLGRRAVPLTVVAKQSGVPYDTLKKIANGSTPNPGVRHVQAIADYFDGIENAAGVQARVEEAEAPVGTAAPAITKEPNHAA